MTLPPWSGDLNDVQRDELLADITADERCTCDHRDDEHDADSRCTRCDDCNAYNPVQEK